MQSTPGQESSITTEKPTKIRSVAMSLSCMVLTLSTIIHSENAKHEPITFM